MSPRQLLVSLLTACVCSAAHAGELTVSAASSLTNVFRELARHYEIRHPGTTVRLNFAASGTLLQQIARGAPVDVLATADQDTMDQAEAKGLVVANERRNFAGNSLVVVVPADSLLRLKSLQDLAQPRINLVAMGNPASVPAGRYALRALQTSGAWPSLKGRIIHTQNVRQALDYVARGEVEAGFVYATDAPAQAGKVRVAFTVPLPTPVHYPAAPATDAVNTGAARSFVQYLLSPEAQALLAQAGFQRP